MRQLRRLYSATRNDNYIGRACAISISRIDATFQGLQLPRPIVDERINLPDSNFFSREDRGYRGHRGNQLAIVNR